MADVDPEQIDFSESSTTRGVTKIRTEYYCLSGILNDGFAMYYKRTRIRNDDSVISLLDL